MSAQPARQQLGIVRPASGEMRVVGGDAPYAQPQRSYHFDVVRPCRAFVREYGPADRVPPLDPRDGIVIELADGAVVHVVTRRPG